MTGATPPALQRVLVTGAAGFIGGRLCERLVMDGMEVYGVSREARSGGGVHWLQADLSCEAETRRVFDTVGPEVIFHLAGRPSASRGLDLVLPTLQQNLVAAVNVMVAAAEVGAGRVVLAGSLEEGDALQPDSVSSSPYALSKQAASAYARMLHSLHGLPIVIAKIFMVYGPGQTDPEKLIPYVITSLLRGESPRLGSGERPVDWVHVDDVVDALVATARAEGLTGQTIDVGSGELTTIRSVVEQVVEIIGTNATPMFGQLPEREREAVSIADTTRTFETTGWQPECLSRTGCVRRFSGAGTRAHSSDATVGASWSCGRR